MNSDICASMTEISEATTEMPTELPSRLDDPMPPGMRLTKENGAAAYDALCDDAVADAFTKITPWLDSPTLIRLLAHAWVENADDLVKIIFQTGNARKNEGGKRDKPQFVKSYLWLMQHFPATALRNFHLIPDNTCLKHTLDILMFTFYGVYKRSDFLSAPERMYQLQVADHKRKREGEFRKDRNARRRLGAKRMREKFAQSKNVPLESLLLQRERTGTAIWTQLPGVAYFLVEQLAQAKSHHQNHCMQLQKHPTSTECKNGLHLSFPRSTKTLPNSTQICILTLLQILRGNFIVWEKAT